MPGISANLTDNAYAIWETVPKKTRREVNSMGGPMTPGRSYWLSSVIIAHHRGHEQYVADIQFHIDEKKELMDKLRDMTACRDALQKHVLGTDGPKS